MNTSKKLFLLAIAGLGLNLQLSASEYSSTTNDDSKLLNFTSRLEQGETATAKNTARWMKDAYAKDESMANKLRDIINSEKTVKEQMTSILQLKTDKETEATSQNQPFFANVSSMAKAAAALMLTVGIVSYLYFASPWTKTTEG